LSGRRKIFAKLYASIQTRLKFISPLALFWLVKGWRVEAGARFKEAIRIKPDAADAHIALARWLAGQGEKEQAAKHYEEALRLMKLRPRQGSSSRSAAADELLNAEKPMDAPVQ
jgi:Tfp pilus assembly protein PilF